MKKIWLIAFIFNLCCCFSAAIDFDSPVFGIKADFGFAEGVFYVKDDSVTYGAALFSKYIFPSLNMTLKIGKLSAAGGYSKLNSPALSASASAFSCSVSTANGMTANLPGSSSYSKPLSIFWEWEHKANQLPLQKFKINAFAIPSNSFENAAVSVSAKIKASKKLSLSAACTSGIFPLEENIKSSWFFNNKNEKYYHKQKVFCQNLQLGFSAPKYSSLLIFSAYQSPFGTLDFCTRTENLIRLNKTSINFAAFYASEDLISSSQKNIESQLQLKAGLHHTFIKCLSFKNNVFPLFINTGFNSYIHDDFMETITIKSALGVRCTSDSFTISVTGSFSGEYPHKTPGSENNKFTVSSWSIQTKQIFLLKDFKPTLTQTFNFSHSPDNQKGASNQKFALSWIFPKNPYLSGNVGMTLSQKNGIADKTAFSFGVSVSYTWKQIKCTAKITGKIQ